MEATSPQLVRSTSAEAELAAPFLSLASDHRLSPASLGLIRRLEVMDEHRASQTLRLPAGAGRHALVGSGWAARYRLLSDGRRQIISMLLPGDLVQTGGNESAEAGLPLTALTRVRLLNAKPLRTAADEGGPEHESLGQALAAMQTRSEGRLVDQIIRLGRQNGLERTAHIFAELHARMTAAGLCERDEFHMPLTQECLADVLGLSIVHVNRTLQQLRREGLIRLSHSRVKILNVGLLHSLADFGR